MIKLVTFLVHSSRIRYHAPHILPAGERGKEGGVTKKSKSNMTQLNSYDWIEYMGGTEMEEYSNPLGSPYSPERDS